MSGVRQFAYVACLTSQLSNATCREMDVVSRYSIDTYAAFRNAVARVSGLAPLRSRLRAVLLAWLILLAGPVSTLHAAVHDMAGTGVATSLAVSAGTIVEEPSESGSGRVPAPVGQSSHCAVCPGMPAMPAANPDGTVLRLPSQVIYRLHLAVDVTDHAPAPLCKPPRI